MLLSLSSQQSIQTRLSHESFSDAVSKEQKVVHPSDTTPVSNDNINLFGKPVSVKDYFHASGPSEQKLDDHQSKTSSSVAPAKKTLSLKRKSPSNSEHLKSNPTAIPSEICRSRIHSIIPPSAPVDGILCSDDFAGLSSFSRNAGASRETIAILRSKVDTCSLMAVALVWKDLTCSHAPTSMKFCTPSQRCDTWYCICDRQIRAKHSFNFNSILAAVAVFHEEPGVSYFLPLLSNESKPLVQCATTIQERLSLLFHIVTSPCPKLVYNTQLVFMSLISILPELNSQPNKIAWNLFDPRVAAYLCESNISESKLELDALFSTYGITTDRSMSAGFGKVTKAVFEVTSELVGLLRLHPFLNSKIITGQNNFVFQRLEMPLACILSRMERDGVSIDIAELNGLTDGIQRAIDSINSDVLEMVKKKYNLASPDQVAQLLFHDLQLPVLSSSSVADAKKHASTSEEELLKISHLHPAVNMVLSFRSLSKIISTYIEGIKPFVLAYQYEESGLRLNSSSVGMIATPTAVFSAQQQATRVHPLWNQTTVRTGRLSCCRPNLQNIPTKQIVNAIHADIRSVFKASPGYEFT
jgi:hypothetical protein